MMVGVTRGLQIAYTREERRNALQTPVQVIRNIGTLARGLDAELYADPNFAAENDDAPPLGTPAEIIDRLKRLASGGVGYVLLVDPAPSPAALQTFAREIMPALADWRASSGRS